MDKVVNIDFHDSLSYHQDDSLDGAVHGGLRHDDNDRLAKTKGQDQARVDAIPITKEDVQLYVDYFKNNKDASPKKPSLLPPISGSFLKKTNSPSQHSINFESVKAKSKSSKNDDEDFVSMKSSVFDDESIDFKPSGDPGSNDFNKQSTIKRKQTRQ